MADNKMSVFRGLTLISHLGIVMIIPIFGGVFLGSLADKKLGTNNIFLIIFTILGVGTGFLNVYKIVMKDIKKK